MLQVSLTTLMVGGAALSMAYYDGFILMFAITAALRGVVRASPAVEGLVPAPRWKTLGRRRLAPVHP